MIRILLVDDHAAFRQPLAFMLERELDMSVAGQAGSLSEARPQLGGVDVALVDLDLPDGNGLELLSDLRSVNPKASVLILTASAQQGDVARAVEAGASGLLHKSASIDEIIDAVRRVSQGEQLLKLQEMVKLLRLASRQREADWAAQTKLGRLTQRELEVLQALAEGLSDKEIGERLHLSTETVRTHMGNILGKLGVDSRLKALIFAVRHGIVQIQ